MAKDNKAADKVFDVNKPGKTSPDSSSRPLIIGHKNMLAKDPMMKSEADLAEEQRPSTAPIPVKTSSTIEPISTTSEDTKVEEDKPAEKVHKKEKLPPSKIEIAEAEEKPPADEVSKEISQEETVNVLSKSAEPKEDKAKEEPKEEKDEQAKKEPEAPSEKSEEKPQQPSETPPEPPKETEQAKEPKEDTKDAEAAGDSSANTAEEQDTTPAEQAIVKKQQDEKVAKEELAKQEAIEKMITSKKYDLPIGVKTRKKANRRGLLVLLLLLLLAVIGGDLLIDAGVIKTSVKPPIRIFNSQ